ncbi:hypothetical protein DLAC_01683 [Tieghemostelium lacteum]|uniref:Transmembrane protein n=1 Tax=Tieghemostelium lacteum TaxID=361077 RepID=A0A152A627_TIELA|nr:hypothetical protein DLAC_01683 [Tieghemostelium lacteum]|eukprot:KYR01678.1 hypothetical protein DLAC_01683 [Tieghemostelium lacteum]
MKYLYNGLIIVLVYLICNFNGNSIASEIRFDNTNDCSKLICNFNNETLWIGGIAPGVNDSAIIDYSNSTFNGGDASGSKGDITQVIVVSDNVEIVNIQLVGPLLVLEIYGQLVVSDNTNLTNSNISILSVNSVNNTYETELSTVTLTDANILLNTLVETYFVNINGNDNSGIYIDQGNLTVHSQDDTTVFIVGTLLINSPESLVLMSGSIGINNLQSQGNITVFGQCYLTFGPSKSGISNINSLQAILKEDSFMEFLDATQFQELDIIMIFQNQTTYVTIEKPLSIIHSFEIDAIFIIPPNLTLQVDNSWDFGSGGGLNVNGQLSITHNMTVGDIGINLKPGSSLSTDPVVIQSNIDMQNSTLTSESTVFNGSISVEASNINLLGSVKVSGNLVLDNHSQLTLTNILFNQSTPTILIGGQAEIAGILSVSIKDQFDGPFGALLIQAEKITGNFSNFQILTFGSDSASTFDLVTSQDGSQQIWLRINNNSNNKKQKLPNWKIALIVIGSLGTIFIVFFIIIKVIRAIKGNSQHDYLSI